MQNHRIIPIRAAHVALALCASIAAAADAGAANPQQGALKAGAAQLAVVLGANPSPAEKRVTELFAERIKDRAGIDLAGPGAQAKFRLVIGTTASNEKIKAFAATRKEVAALGPGCRHTLVELASNELPWARVGGLIATLAAEEPDRTFVLTTAWPAALVSCANATRPAQWKPATK